MTHHAPQQAAPAPRPETASQAAPLRCVPTDTPHERHVCPSAPRPLIRTFQTTCRSERFNADVSHDLMTAHSNLSTTCPSELYLCARFFKRPRSAPSNHPRLPGVGFARAETIEWFAIVRFAFTRTIQWLALIHFAQSVTIRWLALIRFCIEGFVGTARAVASSVGVANETRRNEAWSGVRGQGLINRENDLAAGLSLN